MMPISLVENIDCVEGMKKYPDKFFELAICDPPYGLGDKLTTGGTWAKNLTKADSIWDVKPDKNYFDQLFRVSKHQIIWGGNHFELPDHRGFIVWDKKLTENWTMAMAEYAFTSFDRPSKIYRGQTDNSSRGIERIHICQKPVRLYKWLLKNYAKPGDKILDTHMGSQSSRIAAYDMGFDYWGYEIDTNYFEDGCKRFEQFRQQLKLFRA